MEAVLRRPAAVTAKERRRRLWLGLLILLSPWLLYVVVGNILLAVGLGWALGSTNEIAIRYDRGWTLWFERVHLRGLHFTFQDQNVQFAIDMEDAMVKLDLPALAKRTFHARQLRGSGVSFRMRHRIAPEAKNEPWVRALGKIPDFSDPPLFEAYVPPPPVPDSTYNLWTIHLEDVDVGARELWVQFVRYQGDARARGAFRLKPARHLWVGPAELELQHGRLSIADSELVGDLSGLVRCTVHPFDVRIPVGAEVLRNISADLSLRGERVRLESIPRWFAPDSGVTIDTEPAQLAVDVNIDHGRLATASSLSLNSERARVQQSYVSARGSAVGFRAQVDESGRGGAEFQVRSGSVELLSARSRGVQPAEFQKLAAKVELSSVDLAQPIDLAARELRLEQFSIADARWFNGLPIGSELAFVAGSVNGELWLREQERQLSAKAKAHFVDLRARTEKLEFRANGDLQAQGSEAPRAARSLQATLKVKDVTLRSLEKDQDCPWFSMPAATFELTTPRPRELALAAESPQLTFGWGDFLGKGKLKLNAELAPKPESTEASRLAVVIDAANVDLRSGQRAEQGWQASFTKLSANANVKLDEGWSGRATVQIPKARARIGQSRVSADLSARIELASLDLDRKLARFGTQIDVRRGHLETADNSVKDWWARIRLNSGSAQAARNLDVSTLFEADLRDATPALAILAQQGSLPSILTGLVPLRELELIGMLNRRCRLTDFQFTRASGGPLSARGRLQSTTSSLRSAVLVRLSGLEAVSAGVLLSPNGAEVSMLAGDDWLKTHTTELDTIASRAIHSPCPAPPETCGER